MFLRNFYLLTGLQCVTSQKTGFFITVAVRISCTTNCASNVKRGSMQEIDVIQLKNYTVNAKPKPWGGKTFV
jgi:hypothetical protein